jgi:hypothetical protein
MAANVGEVGATCLYMIYPTGDLSADLADVARARDLTVLQLWEWDPAGTGACRRTHRQRTGHQCEGSDGSNTALTCAGLGPSTRAAADCASWRSSPNAGAHGNDRAEIPAGPNWPSRPDPPARPPRHDSGALRGGIAHCRCRWRVRRGMEAAVWPRGRQRPGPGATGGGRPRYGAGAAPRGGCRAAGGGRWCGSALSSPCRWRGVRRCGVWACRGCRSATPGGR